MSIVHYFPTSKSPQRQKLSLSNKQHLTDSQSQPKVTTTTVSEVIGDPQLWDGVPGFCQSYFWEQECQVQEYIVCGQKSQTLKTFPSLAARPRMIWIVISLVYTTQKSVAQECIWESAFWRLCTISVSESSKDEGDLSGTCSVCTFPRSAETYLRDWILMNWTVKTISFFIIDLFDEVCEWNNIYSFIRLFVCCCTYREVVHLTNVPLTYLAYFGSSKMKIYASKWPCSESVMRQVHCLLSGLHYTAPVLPWLPKNASKSLSVSQNSSVTTFPSPFIISFSFANFCLRNSSLWLFDSFGADFALVSCRRNEELIALALPKDEWVRSFRCSKLKEPSPSHVSVHCSYQNIYCLRLHYLHSELQIFIVFAWFFLWSENQLISYRNHLFIFLPVFPTYF